MIEIDAVAEYILTVFAIIFFIGAFDDFLIDIAHFIFRLTPEKVPKKKWEAIKSQTEDPIAIMVPAWREHDVLESMVQTNLKRINYTNYKWFIGVYPNDTKSLDIALRLQRQYPEKVIAVVNKIPGPTTKAQMINTILETMKGAEDTTQGLGWNPRYIGIHDAEDVIHPLSLKAINAQEKEVDFIQVPIFSLPVAHRAWVAGTYMDEFADLHLKEIPVRQKLRMPIPSAGVGTFFSKDILDMLGNRFGYWLDDNNLTEDYEISMRIARLGGKQKFLFMRDEQGSIISTREYFPDSFATSVRQKTRWTIGIGLQTTMKWGSFAKLSRNFSYKNILGKYAAWRDQKALWSNPLVYIAWPLVLGMPILNHYELYNFDTFLLAKPLSYIMAINLGLFIFRLIQRARFSTTLYGLGHGLLSVPRLILGSVINANAAIRATISFNTAKKEKSTKKIEWDKTQHTFPTEETLNKDLGRADEVSIMH